MLYITNHALLNVGIYHDRLAGSFKHFPLRKVWVLTAALSGGDAFIFILWEEGRKRNLA